MPHNKGDLFNIDNLEDAKKLINEIYSILQKTRSIRTAMDERQRGYC